MQNRLFPQRATADRTAYAMPFAAKEGCVIALVNRQAAKAGYADWDRWRKEVWNKTAWRQKYRYEDLMYKDVIAGAEGKAEIPVAKDGTYRVYRPMADREELVASRDGYLPLVLGEDFCDLFYYGEDTESYRAFLKSVKADRALTADFFSFHSYGDVPMTAKHIAYARRRLDEAGFAKTELHLNEWLPHHALANIGTAFQAADVAAMLVAMQSGGIDIGCIYDARWGIGDYAPLFDPVAGKPHKAYYSFMAFKRLRELERCFRASVPGHATTLVRLWSVGSAGLAAGMSDVRDNYWRRRIEAHRPLEGDKNFKAPSATDCECLR